MGQLKRKIALFVFITGILTSSFSYAEENIKVTFNGKPLTFDVNPYLKNARTLVPFRKILETLGVSVTWDSSIQTVVAKKDSTEIKLKIGNREALVNNKRVALDVAPEISGGRTFVPLRFVSENLGANVLWNGSTKSIQIEYPYKQVVVSMVGSNGYQRVSVKKDIPVKLIFRANNGDDLNGCNRVIRIPKYKILKALTVGDNIVEFTPGEEGVIPFSCGMGMIQSQIKVLP